MTRDGVALLAKNLVFTLLVPGTVAGWLPYSISRPGRATAVLHAVPSVVLFVIGGAIYACEYEDYRRRVPRWFGRRRDARAGDDTPARRPEVR